MENYDVTQVATQVSDSVKEGMKTTTGKDIVGDIFEIVLTKKKLK